MVYAIYGRIGDGGSCCFTNINPGRSMEYPQLDEWLKKMGLHLWDAASSTSSFRKRGVFSDFWSFLTSPIFGGSSLPSDKLT